MADTTEALFGRMQQRYNKKRDKVPPIRMPRWTRQTMINSWSRCGFVRGAEIGTREGLFAEALCQAMPDLELICIDPWAAWPEHSDLVQYADPLDCMRQAQDRLADYKCKLVQARSQDYAPEVPDGALDFIYIDGDHGFDGTMLDLILWSPKVREGGIVAGHDYQYHRYNGVVPAVNAYTANHLVHEWYITGEVSPSYLWRNR